MSVKSAYLGKMAKVFFFTTIAFALWGCIQPQPAKTSEMAPVQTAVTQAAVSAPQQGLSPDEQALLASQASTELQDADCAKCHDTQPADIKNKGAKHKTAIGCLDCHLEHLPLGENTIPECSMCHDSGENDHFKLDNCLSCHRNPHTPLDITVDDVPIVTTGCKTCHDDKGDEFAQYPSKHTALNCTHCHPTKHKKIHKCLTCHEAHAEFMAYEDCLRCHQPHSPMNIVYADDTPSKYCGSCHGDLFEMLTSNQSKHQALNCAYCHKSKHPTVPKCTDCHATPHSASMLTSFNSDCLKCHRNPHDLIY